MKSVLNPNPRNPQETHRTGAVGRWLGRGVVLAATLACPGLHAILLYGTSDVSANATVPTGALSGSGWQYEGAWGSFLGTAIAPNYFVTAKHVGGSVGGTFTYQGVPYTTTASFSSPNSDLNIWQVSSSFPTYAPLYGSSDEAGRNLVVTGRGPARSDTVVNNVFGDPAGWTTGGGGGTQRWGENVVAAREDWGGSLGTLLRADFDRTGGANEAMLGSGDSGGGVFIQEGGTWKLAGINYGISGPYNTTASDSGAFYGAIYNRDGLYQKTGASWAFVVRDGIDSPAYWYSTSISANLSWIQSTAGVPEPTEWAAGTGLALLGFATWRRLRRRTQPA